MLAYGCGSTLPPELGDTQGRDASLGGVAACTPGTVVSCHEALPATGDIVSCIDGVRTCNADGSWSPCMAGTTSGASMRGLRTQVLAVTDAGPCLWNPCDPSCQQFVNEGGTIAAIEAGILEAGSTTVSWYGVIFGPSGAVNPTSAKSGMNDCNWDNTPCQSYAYGKWAACQFDTFCNPGACSSSNTDAGSCLQYAGGQTVPVADGGCPGPNLTMGVGCIPDAGSNAGVFQVPVCNRGHSKLAAGTVVTFGYNTGAQTTPLPPPCSVQPVACAMALAADLQPGTCTDVTTNTPGAGGHPSCGSVGLIKNGQINLLVNADLSIPECYLPDGGYLPNDAGKVGCDDNWTNEHQQPGCSVITAVTSGYGPESYTQQY
ncbi:MAG: hypothetical protein ACRELB_26310, partial [Polyangiaceae bacterium]